MCEFLNEICKKLSELSNGGVDNKEGEVLLISKLPLRSDGLFLNGYQHILYNKLTSDEIDYLSAKVNRKISKQLMDFYKCFNGASFFSDSLSIAGLRKDYSRMGGEYLPVSLEYGNTIELPSDVEGNLIDDSEYIRFGGYADDGSELVMSTNDVDLTVKAVPRWKTEPILHVWDNFNSFLTSEVERMSKIYNKLDGNIDPLNTIPPIWE